jgi:glycosyltransferase involved in cell wall biosynthesis
MKIVQIIPSFNVGGGELLSVRLCAGILRQQPSYEVYLLSLYDPFPSVVYEEALVSGAKIVTLGKRKGFDPLIFLRMLSALISIGPDVIHTHLGALRYSIPAGLLFNRCVKVHTVHNMAIHEASGYIRYLQGIAFRYLGWQPVALSEEVKRSIQNVYRVESDIVTNGIQVDNELFKFSKNVHRAKCGLPAEKKIIITIGRLWHQKNHALLLDAFQKICISIENVTLIIVGDDPTDGKFRYYLENKIKKLPRNISSNIHLLGHRSDIGALLISSDVFVLSSDWEGVPLTLLEAMGYGVPIVSTSVGGIPDVIDNGVDGLLVQKGNCDDLAHAIIRVLIDKNLAQNFVNKSFDKYKNKYSIDMTVSKYVEIYNG